MDDKIFRCTITHVGSRCEKPLLFGLYHIEWWGACNPINNGEYKHIFGKIYKKNAHAKPEQNQTDHGGFA